MKATEDLLEELLIEMYLTECQLIYVFSKLKERTAIGSLGSFLSDCESSERLRVRELRELISALRIDTDTDASIVAENLIRAGLNLISRSPHAVHDSEIRSWVSHVQSYKIEGLTNLNAYAEELNYHTIAEAFEKMLTYVYQSMEKSEYPGKVASRKIVA